MTQFFNDTVRATLLLPVFMLSACGGGGGDSVEPEEQNIETLSGDAGIGGQLDTGAEGDAITTSMPVDANQTPPASSVPAQFIGTYAQACTSDTRVDGFVTITDETLVQTNTFFDDADCTQPGLVQTLTFTIEFPGGVTSTELGEADHIDQTLEIQEIDGEIVNRFGNEVTLFQIILLDDINLYLGAGRGDTAEERITTLDMNPYVRQ